MRKYLIGLLVPTLFIITLGIESGRRPSVSGNLPLRAGLSRSDRVTVNVSETNLPQALIMYSELTGRTQLSKTGPLSQQLDEFFGGYLGRWHVIKLPPHFPTRIEYHRDGLFSVGEVKDRLEALFAVNHLVLVAEGKKHFRVLQSVKAAVNSPSPVPIPSGSGLEERAKEGRLLSLH